MFSWGLGLGLGYIALPISGLGVTGHCHLDSNLTIEAGSFRGAYNGKEFLEDNPATSILLDTFDVTGSLHYAGVRYILGSSFYAALGAGMRTISFDLKAHSGSDVVHETLEAESTIARFAIGNTWSFPSGFYLGGEWLALAVPMTSMVSTRITASGAVSEDIETLEKDAVDVVERDAKRPTIGFTFQLGWEF